MSIHQLYQEKPGEKLVMALRRHPITFVRPTLFFLLMAALPVALAWLVLGANPTFANPLLEIGGTLLASTYYLGIWLFFFSEFTSYYLDISIITTERIIDIDQQGLFGRTIAELHLSRIQDVKSEVKGIFATMFNYGMIEVETAGEEENFKFQQVHDPNGARQKILDLAASEREREGKQIVSEAITGREE